MSGEPIGLRLRCRGVVQGVGFRPWVHRLATELELDGALINEADGVSVQLSGPRPVLECFLRRLARELPAPARLEPLEPRWGQATTARGQGVRIGASAPQALGVGLVAPTLAADRAPCRDCLAELADPASRRCGDPFISCASCGPRYSIALASPYRRAHTTLAGFALCDACRREFDDPGDRRFHAETISCPRCGPRLSFWPGADQECGEPECGADPRPQPQAARPADPLVLASELLAAGRILALQGVGGFQLLVDAANPEALARLRRRKRRPAKPFALLVADEAWLAAAVWIDAAERLALRDGAAPIVLLRRRPSAAELWPAVAPGSPLLGVMRPASPLHHLLLRRFGRPLVATSGNRSGEPLCTEPLEARQRLAGIADAFLIHNRPIARPLDDSLLQVIEGRPVLLRRARGYAPEALPLPLVDQALPAAEAEPLLALSGDLKCAPALAVADRFWLAPHLGDLADGRCQQRLVQGLAELSGVSSGQRLPAPQRDSATPSPGPDPPGPDPPAVPLARPLPTPLPITLVCDAHPGSISQQLARASGLPLRTVQHHLAHGLAVMAEHGLEPPLLVVGFDGLGYGEPLMAAAAANANANTKANANTTATATATATADATADASSGSGQPHREPAAAGHRLWGGELLLIRNASDGMTWQAQHLAGLRPFPLPGADRAMREPRRAALGLLLAADALDHPGAWRVRAAFAPADLALLCQAVATGCQAPLCSSAGRLFDGVAALLGLVQVLSYEGEGGLRLQGAAARAAPCSWSQPGELPAVATDSSLPLLPPEGGAGSWRLDWAPLLFRVLEAVAAGAPLEAVAARFHWDLAEGLASALAAWADRLGLVGDQRRVALAGGCFQNRLLLEATSAGLRRRGLQPWWSQQVPGNDGGLALGQVWAVRRGLAREPL